ncbi:complement C1s subcomponent [Pholidichthys leucotaenia]
MLRSSLLLLLLPHTTLSMLLGWVESPGYPSGYPLHASLNWSRCAPKGHTLSIRLIHLDLEDSQDCENDAVKVFSDRNLISILCGKRDFEELQSEVNPSLFSSPGGCLSLLFHSDYSNTKRHTGFRGFYTIQDFDECQDDPNNACTHFCHNFIGGYLCSCHHGYQLDKDKHTCTVSCSEDFSGLTEGRISVPSSPGSYAENSNCQYILSVELHLQLELHFDPNFDVEQSSEGQCIDALRIETPSGTLGPFCGHTPPRSPFLTHSSDVKILFKSDGSGTNKGFSLNFRTREKVCPAVVTPHSTVNPQKPEYYQGHTVTVTCGVGYVVNTQYTKALSSQYETTCQRTGTWMPSYTCEPVDCGPIILKNSILQLVGNNNQNTQYKDQIQFNCSSKYYTLEGDDTYSCNASGEWVSVGGKKKLPKCIPVCGMPETLIAGGGRILGGDNANLGEIPWQLLISDRKGGASLINDQWAVTAAHVVDGLKNPVSVFGGLVNNTIIDRPDASVMKTERIIIHPSYTTGIPDNIRTDYSHDIALLRFTSRVNLSPNLLPICLPNENRGVREHEQGTVSGWGWAGAVEKFPDLLKYAHITVYTQNECWDTPSQANKKLIFSPTVMFCAGDRGKDSCGGDSGGPFVVPMVSGSGPYYLGGIVSAGAPCRWQIRKRKGYYTKVENFVEWIKKTIETVEAEDPNNKKK